MRYIELILKLWFVILSVSMIIATRLADPYWSVLLVVSTVLGLVLIFNKDASYHFKQSKRDLKIRQVEGVLLVVAAIVAAVTI
jgi:hypothetical protein